MWNFKDYTNKQLFNLSLESENETFIKDSEVRELVEQLGDFNVNNLILLKCELLKEITDRYFSLELAKVQKYKKLNRVCMSRNKRIKRKEDLFITTTLDTCGLVTPKEIIPLFDERIKYDYDFYRNIELEIIYDGKVYTEKDVVKCYYCLLKKEVIGPFELKAYKQSFHNIGDEVYVVDDTNYEDKKVIKHVILDAYYKEFEPRIKKTIHSDFLYNELKSEFLEYDKRLVKKGCIYSITAYTIDYKLDNGLIYSGEQLFKEIK